MSKLFEIIKKEFNPLRDMDDINYRISRPYTNTEFLNNAKQTLMLIKPIGRGSMVGGMAGLAIGFATGGEDMGHIMGLGAHLCAYVDVEQYGLRMVWKYLTTIP